jgi:ketopantoate reductase
MREQHLAAALERLQGVDPSLLVAVQNGWIRPLLEGFPGCGRALIWFMSKGEHYHPLRPSPFSGRYAKPLASALSAGGIEAIAVDDHDLAVAEADKMGFNCVVGLPLAVHGVTLGEYLDRYTDEARAVFSEAVDVCAAALGVEPPAGAFEAFVASVEALRFVATSSAKALELRNGAVVRLADELGLDAPVNRGLLARV